MGTEPKKPGTDVMQVMRVNIEKMTEEFVKVLPKHVTSDEFKRVCVSALQYNPDLLKCTPKSLLQSFMRAATDGLVPDNREGAVVPYGPEAQWLPMVGGLKKKLFQSGKVQSIDVEVVRERDAFDYERGTNAFVSHKKALGKQPPGEIIGVFSVVKMKDGSQSYEVMSLWEVEEVRKKSRGKNTPWNDPVSYPEMVKKTCIRRHAKNLPLSKEDRESFEKVDAEEIPDTAAPVARPRPKPQDYTDADVVYEEPKQEQQAEAEKKPVEEKKAPDKAPEEHHDPDTGEVEEDMRPAAYAAGEDAFKKGQHINSYPKEWDQMKRTDLVEAFKDGWGAAEKSKKGK